jgi:hypothetical protein
MGSAYLLAGEGQEPLRHALAGGIRPADDENCILARDSAEHIGTSFGIDGLRNRLRTGDDRLHDDEFAHEIEALE